jgi:hypothetical protein
MVVGFIQHTEFLISDSHFEIYQGTGTETSKLLPRTRVVQTWDTRQMLESNRFSKVMDTAGGVEGPGE